MDQDSLRVHITTIMEDQLLSDTKKLFRLSLLARDFLEANKVDQSLESLFDIWNETMAETVHGATLLH